MHRKLIELDGRLTTISEDSEGIQGSDESLVGISAGIATYQEVGGRMAVMPRAVVV